MARRREFDIDDAVEKATELFWRNGYDRTSLSDLTETIGCKPPSFYFAFGSKDGLFQLVLERYYRLYLGAAEQALEEPTARQVAENLLSSLADIYTDAAHPPGCLVIKCATSGSQNVDVLLQRQSELRLSRRQRLVKRLERAVAEGDLPANSHPEELAHYLLVLGSGMALDAQMGSSREMLGQFIRRALASFPTVGCQANG